MTNRVNLESLDPLDPLDHQVKKIISDHTQGLFSLHLEANIGECTAVESIRNNVMASFTQDRQVCLVLTVVRDPQVRLDNQETLDSRDSRVPQELPDSPERQEWLVQLALRYPINSLINMHCFLPNQFIIKSIHNPFIDKKIKNKPGLLTYNEGAMKKELRENSILIE